MKKRVQCGIFCLCLLFLFTACGKNKEKGEYQVYYLSIENNKILSEDYNSRATEREELIAELL